VLRPPGHASSSGMHSGDRLSSHLTPSGLRCEGETWAWQPRSAKQSGVAGAGLSPAARPGLRCTERAETRRRRAVGRVRAWVRRPLHRRCTRALHRRRWPGTRSLAGLPIPLRRIAQVCSMTTADAANPTACPRGHPRFAFHAPLSAMGASTHTRNKAGCSVFLTQSGRPQPL
jgi:hypothetical protein